MRVSQYPFYTLRMVICYAALPCSIQIGCSTTFYPESAIFRLHVAIQKRGEKKMGPKSAKLLKMQTATPPMASLCGHPDLFPYA